MKQLQVQAASVVAVVAACIVVAADAAVVPAVAVVDLLADDYHDSGMHRHAYYDYHDLGHEEHNGVFMRFVVVVAMLMLLLANLSNSLVDHPVSPQLLNRGSPARFAFPVRSFSCRICPHKAATGPTYNLAEAANDDRTRTWHYKASSRASQQTLRSQRGCCSRI